MANKQQSNIGDQNNNRSKNDKITPNLAKN